jgi:hypothetical protein
MIVYMLLTPFFTGGCAPRYPPQPTAQVAVPPVIPPPAYGTGGCAPRYPPLCLRLFIFHFHFYFHFYDSSQIPDKKLK